MRPRRQKGDLQAGDQRKAVGAEPAPGGCLHGKGRLGGEGERLFTLPQVCTRADSRNLKISQYLSKILQYLTKISQYLTKISHYLTKISHYLSKICQYLEDIAVSYEDIAISYEDIAISYEDIACLFGRYCCILTSFRAITVHTYATDTRARPPLLTSP